MLGERGEQLVNEEALLALYHREGRGGINPVILSFVSILQFLEDIPDRQAAEMAVLRMDWKYALRQELSWEGFHYADLCNFRKRLREGGQAYLIFEQLLEYGCISS
ncbi:MAG: transposase [Anaerolineae bacterium]|nr:transposase [Anaerolineae bacterium]